MNNNEAMGIAAEVAIARTFNIFVNDSYANRADSATLRFLLDNSSAIKYIFEHNGIPIPVRHIAEGQNPIDFILQENKTLSVKTNQGKMGKVAPQIIGQPTQETFFNYLQTNDILTNFEICNYLSSRGLVDCYENRAKIFKEIVINHIDLLIKMYWRNMFECDYLIHFYNLKIGADPLENYDVFPKALFDRHWQKELFTFTQTLTTWNESTTLKYAGVTWELSKQVQHLRIINLKRSPVIQTFTRTEIQFIKL